MKSNEYRMSSGQFAREMIFRHAWAWLLSLSVLGVAGLALGIAVDMRWLFGSLFILFVVAPMLLTLLYYHFGLRREAYVNTIPHKAVIDERGVVMRLRLEEEKVRDEFFAYSEMQCIKTGLNSISVPLKAPAKGFLWIPRNAFDTDDEMADFIHILARGIDSANSIKENTHIFN